MISGLRKRCVPQRYVLTAMSFLAFLLNFHMTEIFSASLTEMVRSPERKIDTLSLSLVPLAGNKSGINFTTGQFFYHVQPQAQGEERFDWSEADQGLMLSAFFWGTLVTPILGGIVADRYGGKHVAAISILVFAITSLLVPVAASGGVAWVVVVRVIAGLGEGMTYPGVINLMSKWIPEEERGLLGCIIFGGVQLGIVTANILTGGLLSIYPDSWSPIYYISGGIGLLWVLFFYLLCSNEPTTHPFITDGEKKFLIERILPTEKISTIPWWPIIKSRAVNAYLIGIIGFSWCNNLMLADLPKYMKQVMNYSRIMNGVMTSLPFIVMWVVSMLSGILCDKLVAKYNIKPTTARKILTSFSLICPTVGQIGAAYLDSDPTVVIVFFCIGLGGLGGANAGVELLPNDISPNFSGTIVALSCVWTGVTGIIAPYLVGIMAPNQTAEEWRPILLISAGICIIALILFNLLASAEIQPWNEVSGAKTLPEEGRKTEKDATKVTNSSLAMDNPNFINDPQDS